MAKQYEKVEFKLIHMPCCGHSLCWVNPRYPIYCPECGKLCSAVIKQSVVLSDSNAILELDIS